MRDMIVNVARTQMMVFIPTKKKKKRLELNIAVTIVIENSALLSYRNVFVTRTEQPLIN